MRLTFSALERLKRERDIDALFQLGKAHSFYPIRAVMRAVPRPEGEWAPVRLGVSAPKKKFRRAHDRARVKRMLREAWRQRKAEVYAVLPPEVQLHLFIIYTGTELPDWATVTSTLDKLIVKLLSGTYAPLPS
jgi:ribonuclease P protein component